MFNCDAFLTQELEGEIRGLQLAAISQLKKLQSSTESSPYFYPTTFGVGGALAVSSGYAFLVEAAAAGTLLAMATPALVIASGAASIGFALAFAAHQPSSSDV